MKDILKITLILIIQFSACYAHAQSDYFDYKIMEGKFIDKETKQFIPSVNIYNESERNWDFANTEGYFKIWVDIGDTLMFSAIGYLSTVLFITDSLVKENILIKLDPRTYEIGEAVIKALKPYSQFKQDVLNLKLPYTELDSIADCLTMQSRKEVKEADYERKVNEVFAREKGTLFVINLGSIASYVTNKLKEKQNTNPKKAYKNEHQQQIIASKYNNDIVRNITKLNNVELIEFMIFCDFNSEFLVLASQYEITKAISDKFKEYKKTHKSSVKKTK